jgi:hypothetical protein
MGLIKNDAVLVTLVRRKADRYLQRQSPQVIAKGSHTTITDRVGLASGCQYELNLSLF